MLDSVIAFVSANSIIAINLSILLFVSLLTFTAKEKDIGVLVGCYCASYLLMDLAYFGLLENHSMLAFDKFAVFYLMCLVLTFIVFVYALHLFIRGNNVVGLYARWLLVCLFFDGMSSIFQLKETNDLLMIYNVIQNIGVYVDLFVVFIGMDHVIKRKHDGSRIFIERINNYLDACRFIPIIHSSESKKCNQQNYSN